MSERVAQFELRRRLLGLARLRRPLVKAPVGRAPIHPAALLAGLAAGWQWSGLRTILASALDPLPATTTMLGCIVLLTAALGPRVPERIVLVVARFIRRRSRRASVPAVDGTGTFWMLRAVRDRDESLMWLSLSVLASAAGLVSLATLAMLPAFIVFYQYLLDKFFWTNLTLAVLEWFGVGLLVGGSWVINGVVMAALVPVVGARSSSHRSSSGVAAGVLLGLGLAWLLHEVWVHRGLSGDQEFMIGVLPMFVLSAVSARLSQWADRLPRLTFDAESTAPELTPVAGILIWSSLVVWGFASVLMASGWLGCRSAADPACPAGDTRLSWYVLILGIGVAAASFRARKRKRSASGCGMAIWGAGVASGVAATLTSYRPSGWAGAGIQVLILALPLGYALHYLERAWLARAGSETLGFAQLASVVLTGLALGLIGARWWALPTLGCMGTMTTGSLIMLAAGGLMQIYEDTRPTRVQGQRLGLVFASIAAAIVLFPGDAKRWAKWQGRHQTGAPVAVSLKELTADEPPCTRDICLIGVDPLVASYWQTRPAVRVDVLSMSACSATAAVPSSAGEQQIAGMSAFRAFRLAHRRYDLIYQRSVAGRPVGRFGEYSSEWFSRLVEHALPGGRVIVDAPLAGMTAGALAVVAATFERAMAAPVTWAVVDSAGQPALRLMARPGLTAAAGNEGQGPGWPVDWLLSDRSSLRAHSLRRDRITPTLKAGAPEPVSSLVQWLQRRRSSSQAAGRR